MPVRRVLPFSAAVAQHNAGARIAAIEAVGQEQVAGEV
jgi:hypothetical protein